MSKRGRRGSKKGASKRRGQGKVAQSSNSPKNEHPKVVEPNPDEQKTGLVMPGGGARGAYQAGVLRAIADFLPDKRNPFPVVTGVSVGAINAAAIARFGAEFRHGATNLAALWSRLSPDRVYCTDFPTISKTALHWLFALTLGGLSERNPRSLLDNAPLRQLLEEEMDFSGISRALESGNLDALGITASSYDTGRAVTFFQDLGQRDEWHRARRDGLRRNLSGAHILASAALPFIFPAEAIGNEYFGDGSLRLTAALSPAIRLGADRLFIIGIRDESRDQGPLPGQAAYPSLGGLAGYLLDAIFMDRLDDDVERLCRINKTLSLLPEENLARTRLKKIDILSLHPSEDIRDIARKHIGALPWTVRLLLRGVGGYQADSRLPSYLLFEPGFCRALIDLGRRDAEARRAEIISFLQLDKPASSPKSAASAAQTA